MALVLGPMLTYAFEMSTDASYPVGPDNKVRRYAARGHYEHDTVHAIIDEALFCHVSFIDYGAPVTDPQFTHRVDALDYLKSYTRGQGGK